MATTTTQSATGIRDIDGLLSGYKWNGIVTYSFPDSASDYSSGYGYGEPTASGFAQISAAQQQVVFAAMALVSSYTNISLVYAGADDGDIQIAQSSEANPTAYAYYPAGEYEEAGDVWFGTYYNFRNPQPGDYYYLSHLHEIGHALGLKHSQATGGVANVSVPSGHDGLEYTVMSYRSYLGGPTNGYTNEKYGYPTTYMMNDILALQTMYGADYTTHDKDTVYAWSPTTGQEFINGVGQAIPGGGSGGAAANRVFMTVWDGGGNDTYDFSAYTTATTIDLNPGAYSITSNVQRAYLGNGNYAHGNVYNAYLYSNDPRSYIENATGGSGADTITGNLVANKLDGGAGNDTLVGLGGADALVGGSGTDRATYTASKAGVDVSLATGLGHGGDAEGDTLTTIENLIGSSYSDTLEGGAGNNLLTGGSGTDTVTYAHATAAVTVSLALTSAQSTGGAGSDTLSGFENLTGSAYNDKLTGSSGANLLSGLAGNDAISGSGGGDTLIGAVGADTLTGGSGADAFVFNFANEGLDTITDFVSKTDFFRISAAGFGGGLVAGVAITLKAIDDVSHASSASGNGYFIYDNSGTSSGTVYWDSNGGSGIDAVAFAKLAAGAALIATDFLIV